MEVPTFRINNNNLQDLIRFIYKQEQVLKEFGAIRIQLGIECKLALKKRRKNLLLCPKPGQIVKASKNEGIYFVQNVGHDDDFAKQSPLIMDEHSFWSLLSCSNSKSRQLNTSSTANKSFFSEKTSREYFDIHCLPKQSLLKVAGTKITRQFVPCVRRAHQAGSIFPLSCAQQRLFSIDYHHEGGSHHWYIIPPRERENLRRIISQQTYPACLDHGQLFIDPAVLNRHHIRYHQVIQHPNELIVLSASTLAQSFTYDASWSESIAFALPSWIEDGHASVPIALCQCNIPYEFLLRTIDVNLFTRELIQRYVTSHLSVTSEDPKEMDATTGSVSNSIETNPSNAEIIPMESLMPSSHTSSTSLLTPLLNSFFSAKDTIKSHDNNVQVQSEQSEEGNFLGVSDSEANIRDSINSMSSDQLCAANSLTNTYRNVSNNCNIDTDFLSYQQLMDLFPTIINIDSLVAEEPRENIDKDGPLTKNKRSHKAAVARKTLFVSGLKNDVSTNDLRRYFTGCIKITVKRCHARSDLKYAFILHRTFKDVELNIQRPIDYALMGPKCRIEYTNSSHSAPFHNQWNIDNRTLVVRRIPNNVSENDLNRLFVDCRAVKYYPARNIHVSTATKKVNSKNTISPGYAYILYDDAEQVARVMKHANQYRINGELLVISLYRTRKQLIN